MRGFTGAILIISGVSLLGFGNLADAAGPTQADFDFYRAAPPGGYKNGLPAAERTDVGSSDIPPETLGTDFYPYRPPHLSRNPVMPTGRPNDKLGRNDPCWCGSGRKFKKCHGR